jgi:hypothetical protein|tara:strand:+ start:688 stop:894 length:207 start_codon:yes stop_codon:yes gene_type:complete
MGVIIMKIKQRQILTAYNKKNLTRKIYDKETGEILAEVDASKSINKANLEDGIGVTDGYAQHSYYLDK